MLAPCNVPVHYIQASGPEFALWGIVPIGGLKGVKSVQLAVCGLGMLPCI